MSWVILHALGEGFTELTAAPGTRNRIWGSIIGNQEGRIFIGA